MKGARPVSASPFLSFAATVFFAAPGFFAATGFLPATGFFPVVLRSMCGRLMRGIAAAARSVPVTRV
mgnify:CR=1 FL=1